ASLFGSSLFKNVVYSLKASALIGQVVLSLKSNTGLSSDAFHTSFKSLISVNSFGSAIFIPLFLSFESLTAPSHLKWEMNTSLWKSRFLFQGACLVDSFLHFHRKPAFLPNEYLLFRTSLHASTENRRTVHIVYTTI